ncbi:MAG: DUF4426 domain-containing protein [Nevskiales bacterium]|nr:DUF4426 domain-containing protein [Nevskiales bacterium]
MRPITTLLLWLLCALPAAAEQYVDHGEYRIHYAALNSTTLTPEVARQFGVDRSRNQVLLVLSPQQRDDGGDYRPVAATASGTATTLLGHVQKLELRPVREGPVHYVVATFETLDGEFMTVNVDVLPAGANQVVNVRFKQQFYRD